MMRIALAGILALCPAAALLPDDAGLRRFEYGGTGMAAPVRIVLYASDEDGARRAATAAFARIRELNSVLSDYDPASELSRLSGSASGGDEMQVSADLWRVLARAEQIFAGSKGAFDITVGPVVRLWRRARQLHRLPDSKSLEEALALVDGRSLRLNPDRHSVRLERSGMRLDLGGIAKGYAADEAIALLRARGVRNALVDLGGDIALGDSPPDVTGWRVGVARSVGSDSDGEDDLDGTLWLSRGGVATSGDSEQFVEIDGRRYSHIVDPRTGVGVIGPGSVTVVAPDAMTADALASAVSVLGPTEGLKLLDRTPGAAGRIVQRTDGKRKVYESKRWRHVEQSRGEPIAGDSASERERETTATLGVRQEAAAKDAIDPTVTPPVAWLSPPAPLPAAEARSEEEMKPYSERIPGTDVTFDMAPIPGGRFLMGSPPDEAGRRADEGPRHEVILEPFWMGTHEVTWEEYELWGLGYDAQRTEHRGGETGAHDRMADAITRPTKPYSDMTFGMGHAGYPAICMTQLAAKVYCKWLSAKTGRYYRLPTEAEWEYAARAGTTSAYSFGDDPKHLGDYAWYFMNSGDRYHKVGQKKPNPWGLFDIHGNVAEWVLDAYTPGGYERSRTGPYASPLVVPRAIYPRVARGGSWTDDAEALRSAARTGSDPGWKMGDPQMPQSIWYHTDATFVGFRVVRPLRIPTVEEARRYDLDPAQREALADYLDFLGGRE